MIKDSIFQKFKVSVFMIKQVERVGLLQTTRVDGAFCKYCVLFSLNYRGVGSQLLG